MFSYILRLRFAPAGPGHGLRRGHGFQPQPDPPPVLTAVRTAPVGHAALRFATVGWPLRPMPPLRSGRIRPRPLTRLWLSATALSTPSPHCRSDSPGGACRPSLRCGRVAFASYASASLRPDPATASAEAIASLQVSRGWFGGTPVRFMRLFVP